MWDDTVSLATGVFKSLYACLSLCLYRSRHRPASKGSERGPHVAKTASGIQAQWLAIGPFICFSLFLNMFVLVARAVQLTLK